MALPNTSRSSQAVGLQVPSESGRVRDCSAKEIHANTKALTGGLGASHKSRVLVGVKEAASILSHHHVEQEIMGKLPSFVKPTSHPPHRPPQNMDCEDYSYLWFYFVLG